MVVVKGEGEAEEGRKVVEDGGLERDEVSSRVEAKRAASAARGQGQRSLKSRDDAQK